MNADIRTDIDLGFIQYLKEFDALRDNDEIATHVESASFPAFATDAEMNEVLKKTGLGSKLLEALRRMNISKLYKHQVEAILAILGGQDVVLEAGTASGKTLSFNIPVVSQILKEKFKAHALVIHPMKAVSNDQYRQFTTLTEHLTAQGLNKVEAWVVDGDTAKEHLGWLKETPVPVLFTNPEMLHLTFLQAFDKWRPFLSRLRYVILDEIHEYRGYFGTNVAFLLRRFFAKLALEGIRPQVILATATCGNPLEHAQRLTERNCTLVRLPNRVNPERHYIFVVPSLPEHDFMTIYKLRIALATLAAVSKGMSTIVFCPSRKMVEDLASWTRKKAPEYGIPAELIAPYKSGYTSEQRRSVEEKLREGEIRAVFCTNALEIGIDIGRLDVCILAGFPDSVLSTWQRIGRVGRSFDKKAYVLAYALNNPFDKLLAAQLETFFTKPLDQILVAINNEEIFERHVPLIRHECGLPHSSRSPNIPAVIRDAFGPSVTQMLAQKLANRNFAKGIKPNYGSLSLRGNFDHVLKLVHKGTEIGEISATQQFREAYLGAIYQHFGTSYKVISHLADSIELELEESYLATEGKFWTNIDRSETLAGRRFGEQVATYFGKITVYENFGGYRLIDTRTQSCLEDTKANSARQLSVRGFWIHFEDVAVFDQSLNHDQQLKHLLFHLEQLLRIGAPFILPCDRHDFATHSSADCVYLYETVPGGIGIAEKTLEIWPEIIRTALDIVEKCSCKRGCPKCIIPPRTPVEETKVHKEHALAVGRRLLELYHRFASESPMRLDPATGAWVSELL
ncbi:MAG: DEAD/DEAH box helicase [Candidatus Hydrogenedentota bacterium]|uniref:ATP-dependent RNA helicase n=1 Tax=Sumerlaea chitinivorans TaxID=2250252 RepID=A0A2Z4Y725_SUMC1|nr:ATP-dependent RNA helicase [Candidatus Sumerlaea chitinivorans]MCX7964841.1 DEAD/DEAH box helicase [Candidatus Sumerlaea chitinivorans]RMH23818.1 MAG: DEAD/DEAH box helicase [Candidatus Hydrogenedentota bacterium]